MKMQLYIKNFMWLEFTFQNRSILIQTQLKINQNATKVEIIYTRGVHKKKHLELAYHTVSLKSPYTYKCCFFVHHIVRTAVHT